MPQVKAKVIELKSDVQGRLLAIVQFNRKRPNDGEIFTAKWGAARSIQQNKFYWKFLEWILEHGGLKDEYLSTEELHETLKGRFLSKRVQTKLGFETVIIGSTTELDRTSFGEYIDKVDKAVVEYYHVDTSPFFEEYRDMYASF